MGNAELAMIAKYLRVHKIPFRKITPEDIPEVEEVQVRKSLRIQSIKDAVKIFTKKAIIKNKK